LQREPGKGNAMEPSYDARDASSINSNSHREYLIAELRCAALRARLWQADIESVGVALKRKWISPEQALEALHDCDALHLIAPPDEAEQ
jgi:hypothetical protein